MRDRLLGRVGALATQEQATAWAQRAMAAKNTLTTADCGLVEAAFAARVAELADEGATEACANAAGTAAVATVDGEEAWEPVAIELVATFRRLGR